MKARNIVVALAVGVFVLGESHAAPPPVRVLKAHVTPAAETAGVRPAAVRPAAVVSLENDYVVDIGTLGIRPSAKPMPMSRRPLGTVVGVGNATVAAAPEMAQPSTASAIGTLGGNFIPAESVQYYLNGSLAGTFTANADGVLAVGLNTGAGAGYLTVEEIGVTSTRHAGTVVQVAAAGPYLPGVSAMPHAVNTTAGGKVYLYGYRYPASSSVTLYRNAVSLGAATTNAAGRYFVAITPSNNGDTSALYGSDNGTAGSYTGRSVEERSDAGTPPLGDQNVARSFLSRDVLPSAAGGVVGWTGEGFQPGETVNASGCASAILTADAFGSVGTFLGFPATPGVAQCVLTGVSSSRVARAEVELNPNVTDVPSLIVQSQNVIGMGAGSVTVLFAGLTGSDTGTILIDGVSQGAASTNPSGIGAATVSKPATGFLHAVTYSGTTQTVSGALLAPVELSHFSAE